MRFYKNEVQSGHLYALCSLSLLFLLIKIVLASHVIPRYIPILGFNSGFLLMTVLCLVFFFVFERRTFRTITVFTLFSYLVYGIIEACFFLPFYFSGNTLLSVFYLALFFQALTILGFVSYHLKTCFSIPGLALVVLYILLLNDNIRNVDVFIVPFLITIAAFIFIVFTLISVVKKQFEAEKQLIEQLSEAKEKIIAQEKLLSLSTFAAGVAHDINNPVTHMYGNIPFLEEYIESLSQIANRQNLSNKEREQVTYITEDSKSILDDYKSGFARITEIIRDMKQLFKKKNNEHEEYDVSQLLQSTLEIFSRRGDGISSGVTIATAIESPLPLLCNRNDLLSVFQNLLSNAFDAVGEHGFIHIKARREENNIIINFYDNGTGISPDTLDSIFKPFYSTKEDADNIGVGLTMCKHIIESYFGEITIESEVNHYTDVMITLPVRKPSR